MADNIDNFNDAVTIPVTTPGVEKVNNDFQKTLDLLMDITGQVKKLTMANSDMYSSQEAFLKNVVEKLALVSSYQRNISTTNRALNAGPTSQQMDVLAAGGTGAISQMSQSSKELDQSINSMLASLAKQGLMFEKTLNQTTTAMTRYEYAVEQQAAKLSNQAMYSSASAEDKAFNSASKAAGKIDNQIFSQSSNAAGKADAAVFSASSNAAARADAAVFNASSNAINKYTNALIESGQGLRAYGQEVKEVTHAQSRFNEFFGASIVDTIKVQAAFILAYEVIQHVFSTFREGAKYIADYDKAITNLQAITRATDPEMEVLKHTIGEVGKASYFSSLQVAEGAKQLAEAGLSTVQIGKTLEGVVILAGATGLTMKESAYAVSEVMKQFKLDPSQSTDIANTFVEALNNTTIKSLPQLTEALGTVAEIAQGAGLSFKETTTILGGMTQGMKDVEAAAAGFRAVLSVLEAPTAQFKKVLREIGLNTDDVSLRTHNFTEVLKTLKGLTEDQATEAFSRRGATAFLAAEDNTNFTAALGDALEHSNAAILANDKNMEALEHRWEALTAALKRFTEDSGIVKFLGDVLDGWTKLFNYLDSHKLDISYDNILTPDQRRALDRYNAENADPDTSNNLALIKSLRPQYNGPSDDQIPYSSPADPTKNSLARASMLDQLHSLYITPRGGARPPAPAEIKKSTDAAIKQAQDLLVTIQEAFKHVNDALALNNQHLNNMIKGSGDINSPLYGKYGDAEVGMIQQKLHDNATKGLQNQVNDYPAQLAQLQNILSLQQQGVANAALEVKMGPDLAARTAAMLTEATAQKGVVETQKQITDLTQQQALAQGNLNDALGIGAEANATFGEQMQFVLGQYAKTMAVQSDWKTNLKANVTDALDNARNAFSTFVQNVASGTKSIGASFKSMAISVLQSILKMESDQLAMSIFGKIAGFAGSLFGGGMTVDSGVADLTAASQEPVITGSQFYPHYQGGLIRGYAGGGDIGRDSQMSILRKGEYVLRNSAVDMIGKDNLDQMNAMGNRRMSSAAKGMGQMPVIAPAVQTTNVWVIPPTQKPSLTASDVLVTITDDIIKGGTTKKLIKSVQQGTL